MIQYNSNPPIISGDRLGIDPIVPMSERGVPKGGRGAKNLSPGDFLLYIPALPRARIKGYFFL